MSHFFVFFSSFYIHIFIDIDSRCLSWMLFLLLFHHFTKLFCRAALEISRIGSYASKSQTYRLTAKRYAWKIRELIIDIFNEVFVAASANGIHHIQYARFSKTWKCHMFAARCGLICWNFFFFQNIYIKTRRNRFSRWFILRLFLRRNTKMMCVCEWADLLCKCSIATFFVHMK